MARGLWERAHGNWFRSRSLATGKTGDRNSRTIYRSPFRCCHLQGVEVNNFKPQQHNQAFHDQ